MDAKETNEAVGETNDAGIKQELLDIRPLDSSADNMDVSIATTGEENFQMMEVPTAPEINFFVSENTEEDNNPLLISIIKPEPKISPDLELIKSQVDSWRVILQRLPTNTHTGLPDIKQEPADVDQTDPDDVTTPIPEGSEQHEMEDIKYVNTQDYLDIGETVISEQDRARPGPSSKGAPVTICDGTNNSRSKALEDVSRVEALREVTDCTSKLQTTRGHEENISKKDKANNKTITVFKIPKQEKSASSNSGNLRRHMRVHTGEKKYKCDLCDYASSDGGHLKGHMRRHTGDKPYKCDLCDYACRRRSQLTGHTSVHTGDNQYKCDLCVYASSNSGNLRRHMRVHTGEKKYKCDLCDYASSDGGNLKRHMRVHTGENQYKCDLCDYACRRRSQLTGHTSVHTGENQYKCDLCVYASSNSGNLRRHMRVHTGEKKYKCDLCDYASSDGGHLKGHMRRHTGNKPYKCDLCDYASSNSGDLRRHMRVHTGEKKYKCDLCDFASSYSFALKRHMGVHTGEKKYKCDLCEYRSSERDH